MSDLSRRALTILADYTRVPRDERERAEVLGAYRALENSMSDFPMEYASLDTPTARGDQRSQVIHSLLIRGFSRETAEAVADELCTGPDKNTNRARTGALETR